MSCRNCPGAYVFTKEEVEELVAAQLELEVSLLDEETAQKRESVCAECPARLSDTTCLYCGCFTSYRARLPFKSCPHPEGDRWEEAG